MKSRAYLFGLFVAEYSTYGFSWSDLSRAFLRVSDEALASTFGFTVIRRGWFV